MVIAKRVRGLVTVFLWVGLVVGGCGAPAPVAGPGRESGEGAEDRLRRAAREVAEALRDRDFARLAEHVDPEAGVRFSPYSYVEPESLVTLTGDELRAAADGETVQRTWGHHDGTGDPIEMTIGEYFDRFVYDVPYLEEGRVAVDERQGHGNSLDNSADVYPGARIVEYHLPGRNPEYGGMDWRSLRLVFEPRAEEARGWWLVGVIHDEWTI